MGLARYLQTTQIEGVLITQVVPEGPAGRGRIQEGDILLSIGSRKILNAEAYHLTMKAYAEGDTIPLLVWRNGKEIRLSLKATVFPPELAKELAYRLFGLSVETLSKPRFGLGRRLQGGVVIADLHRKSYLAQIGVRPGDIIHKIDDLSTKDSKEFEKAVIKYRNKHMVVILLQRADQLYNISVKF